MGEIELAPHRRADAKRLFEHYDVDDSGFIDAAELLRLCQAMDPGVMLDGVQSSLNDVGASEGLDVNSFCRWVQSMFGDESDEEFAAGIAELAAIPTPTVAGNDSPSKLKAWRTRAQNAEEQLERYKKLVEELERELQGYRAIAGPPTTTASMAAAARMDFERELHGYRAAEATPAPAVRMPTFGAAAPLVESVEPTTKKTAEQLLEMSELHGELAAQAQREQTVQQLLDLNQRLVKAQDQALNATTIADGVVLHGRRELALRGLGHQLLAWQRQAVLGVAKRWVVQMQAQRQITAMQDRLDFVLDAAASTSKGQPPKREIMKSTQRAKQVAALRHLGLLLRSACRVIVCRLLERWQGMVILCRYNEGRFHAKMQSAEQKMFVAQARHNLQYDDWIRAMRHMTQKGAVRMLAMACRHRWLYRARVVMNRWQERGLGASRSQLRQRVMDDIAIPGMGLSTAFEVDRLSKQLAAETKARSGLEAKLKMTERQLQAALSELQESAMGHLLSTEAFSKSSPKRLAVGPLRQKAVGCRLLCYAARRSETVAQLGTLLQLYRRMHRSKVEATEHCILGLNHDLIRASQSTGEVNKASVLLQQQAYDYQQQELATLRLERDALRSSSLMRSNTFGASAVAKLRTPRGTPQLRRKVTDLAEEAVSVPFKASPPPDAVAAFERVQKRTSALNSRLGRVFEMAGLEATHF